MSASNRVGRGRKGGAGAGKGGQNSKLAGIGEYQKMTLYSCCRAMVTTKPTGAAPVCTPPLEGSPRSDNKSPNDRFSEIYRYLYSYQQRQKVKTRNSP